MNRLEGDGFTASITVARFLLLFLLYVAVGILLENTRWIENHLNKPFTNGLVWISARLIHIFCGRVVVDGNILRNPVNLFATEVLNGCNGIEPTLLLWAAVLAYPVTWRRKLLGLVFCAVMIQAINIPRIISLYYLLQYSRALFDWAHLYMWDVLIMI